MIYNTTEAIKIAFVGFGEINSPPELIAAKCNLASSALKKQGLTLVADIHPVTDDPSGGDVAAAIEELLKTANAVDALVICVAGWIPSHAVINITERFKHLPIVLWGLAGSFEGARLVTTADQAGTSALRAVFAGLGYTFRYIYDLPGKPPKSAEVARYCQAAYAARKLRSAKAGMAGYRDMNLYGTLFDGISLKRVTGVEIESFEMLELVLRFEKITDEEKQAVANQAKHRWQFTSPPEPAALLNAAGYYIAASEIAKERGYEAISIKDVDGMKKLLSFPPAPIFMLLSDLDGLCTVPENDAHGSVTQLMLKYLTGQCAAYLEFYEYLDDRLLAGVPDYIPAEITDGQTKIMPAAFGELSQGLLNVSAVKQGRLTFCRLAYVDGEYVMHASVADGVSARAWEEAGWAQPAPQLPGLELIIDDVDAFAQNVMGQHYFIAYGEHIFALRDLCDILGIKLLVT